MTALALSHTQNTLRKPVAILLVLLAILVMGTALAAPMTRAADTDCSPGDIGRDGKVSLDDAIITLQLLTGMDPVTPIDLCADSDANGIIDLRETFFILNHVLAGPQETVLYVPDTGQTACYTSTGFESACPAPGQDMYGQDAQFDGAQPSYQDNGDGTVTDLVTGLMWAQSPDLNNDGDVDADDKRTQAQALAGASSFNLAGFTDWRLPTIKELYSLMNFTGQDPSGYQGTDTSGLVPFIDTTVFEFGYGDSSAGERIIDSQMATSTIYKSTTMNGNETMFGVNFADGRIKGYPTNKTFYVYYVRGDSGYLENDFTDNQDGTITDHATGLMWAQNDSAAGLDFEEALAWAAQKNSENYLGYNDWRLPNVKELQGIVDYTRCPDTTNSAAIAPVFNVSGITNEAGNPDFPCYWSNTTHANMSPFPGGNGAYVAFGRAMGYWNGAWIDVHGAGAQRSDPKTGDPDQYPTGHGPQGDAVRIYNYVRLVRNAS